MRSIKFLTNCILPLSILLILTASINIFAQYSGPPVKKDRLISGLKSRQLQTRDVVKAVKSNGVDFKLTPAVEQELVSAGARPEVIEAVRANYRAPAVVTNGPATNNNSTGKTFSGAPMAKDAIIVLLENGVADAQVRSNVAGRGVNFIPTAADKADIKNAGGSVTLINVIVASYNNPNKNVGGNTAGGNDIGGGSDKYDNLVEKAVYQYDVLRDINGAAITLQEAVRTEPGQARAYQQLGFLYLYGERNFAEAEKYMQQAIDRGGSAVFRVYHDHGALMTDVCEGSLYIAKDAVRFESDNNIHTFETSDADIKEAKVNGKFASMFNARAGSFKIALKNGENKNFNFAPLTNDAAESKIVIRLIGVVSK